jgi:hypothetical protein
LQNSPCSLSVSVTNSVTYETKRNTAKNAAGRIPHC